MWHTSQGNRTLVGAEARLFSVGIDVLLDSLLIGVDDRFDEDATADYPSGVPMFDQMTVSQRIGVLHQIASGLLDPLAAAPTINAVNESAIAAVYLEIRDQLAIEIGFLRENEDSDGDRAADRPCHWRTLVLQAYRQHDPHGGTAAANLADHAAGKFESLAFHHPEGQVLESQDLDSQDIEPWDEMIDSLLDRILWDRDFEMTDLFMDADPADGSRQRGLLGIDEDYFRAVAEDPRPRDVARLVAQTRDLCRGRPR